MYKYTHYVHNIKLPSTFSESHHHKTCSELNKLLLFTHHVDSGGGSPIISTDHLCVLPALIMTDLNVLRSIRGFTIKRKEVIKRS